MSGPANATTNKKTGSRFYEWNGERFWSVTTVIGCLDKPAIPRWAAKEAAFAAVHHMDEMERAALSSVEIAKLAGKNVTLEDELIRTLAQAPWRKRDAAADVGTAVHKAVELYTLGQSLPVYADDVAGHMVQFEKFLNAYAPEFELAEATVYHRGHKWAGTTDGVCTFRKAPPQHQFLVGKRSIIDYKSSNEGRQGHGIYPEVGLQLNAYAHGEFVGMPDGSEAPLPAIEEGAAVWLRPDKWALVPVRIDDEIYNSFRYVIEAFRWATDIAPTVLGKAATAA